MSTEVRYKAGVVIVEPRGKIIGGRVSELRTAILPEVRACDAPRILIDLSHAHRLDSSGLGVLMQAYVLTKHKRGRIGVIHVGKHIRNLLVISRLLTSFEHFNSESAAVAAFGK